MSTVWTILNVLVAVGGSAGAGFFLWLWFKQSVMAHAYDDIAPTEAMTHYPVTLAMFEDEKARLTRACRRYRAHSLWLAAASAAFAVAGVLYLVDGPWQTVVYIGGGLYAVTAVWELWYKHMPDPLTRQIGGKDPVVFLMNEAEQGWPTDGPTLDARCMVAANTLRYASKTTIREIAETLRQVEYREMLPKVFGEAEEAASTTLGIGVGGVLKLRKQHPKDLTTEQADCVAVSRLSTLWSGYLGTTKEAVAVNRMRQEIEAADRAPWIDAFKTDVKAAAIADGWSVSDINPNPHIYEDGVNFQFTVDARWKARSSFRAEGYYSVYCDVTGHCRHCRDELPIGQRVSRATHRFDRADTLPSPDAVLAVAWDLRDSIVINHAASCMWRTA